MSLFGLLSIAGSGVDVSQSWLNTIGSNLANANDAVNPSQTPFLEQQLTVAPGTSSNGYSPNPATTPMTPTEGTGVHVSGVVTPNPNGVLTYDPTNPQANASGYVRTPGISVADQLGNLDVAERSYQANVAVINHAKTIYQAALTIGQ